MRHAMNSLVIAAGFIVTAQAFAQKLHFDEAIRRASERGSARERAQLAVAVAHESYLETQSKFRLEFRPRIYSPSAIRHSWRARSDWEW
jgi:hypothetical protein